MDFELINIVAAVLAAWRLTSAINREKIGQFIRRKFAGEYETQPGMFSYPNTFLSNLIMCFMCLSFWVSILCVAALVVFPVILYPFAISTLVIFLDKVY